MKFGEKLVVLPALILIIILSLNSDAFAARSQAGKAKTLSALTAAARAASQESTNDGADFFKEMANAANALQTYSFASQMTVFNGNKTVEENTKFFFKKPKLVRAEELGPYKKGSLAVLQKDGKVRGHLGGLLSKFVATVDSRSPWTISANGYPLVDSDYYSMSQVMLNFVKEGKKSIVTTHPVTVPGQAKTVYIIELYTDASQKQLMKRAYIDPQTLLPVEWFDYKDGKLFAHTVWKDVRLNTDLNDSLFKI